jgi:hypothetical protein
MILPKGSSCETFPILQRLSQIFGYFFIGNCGRGRFPGVLFRNNLEVLGAVYTSQRMIRG